MCNDSSIIFTQKCSHLYNNLRKIFFSFFFTSFFGIAFFDQSDSNGRSARTDSDETLQVNVETRLRSV